MRTKPLLFCAVLLPSLATGMAIATTPRPAAPAPVTVARPAPPNDAYVVASWGRKRVVHITKVRLAKDREIAHQRAVQEARRRAEQQRQRYLATSAVSIADVWVRLAGCESGGDWHINTGNGYYGGLQITAGNASHYGFARADELSEPDQVRLGKLILRDQGVDAWPICGPRVGLTTADA